MSFEEKSSLLEQCLHVALVALSSRGNCAIQRGLPVPGPGPGTWRCFTPGPSLSTVTVA